MLPDVPAAALAPEAVAGCQPAAAEDGAARADVVTAAQQPDSHTKARAPGHAATMSASLVQGRAFLFMSSSWCGVWRMQCLPIKRRDVSVI